MTQQEFESFIKEQKDAGKDEEEILVIFAKMFQEGKLERPQFEAIVEALGYEITEEFKKLPDDEFKEKILVKSEDEEDAAGEPDTIDEDGGEPPVAEDKPESEDESKPEEEEEEDEETKAMRIMNLKK